MYRRALEAGDDAAALAYGDMLAELGRYGEAEDAYLRAILFPGWEDRLAKLYLRMGDRERAERMWREGMAGGDVDAFREFGWHRFRTGHREEGLRLLEEAAADGDLDARRPLGLAYAELGRDEEAERQFRLAIDEHDVDARLDLADLLARTGREAEARGHYRRAIDLEEDVALAHYRLGHLLARLGEKAEAEVHLAAAQKSGDEDLRRSAAVALAELRRGDTTEQGSG